MFVGGICPLHIKQRERGPMTEIKLKNPLKRMAVHLAHQMDDEREMREGFLPPWKEEEIRANGKYLREEIWRMGYDVSALLYYAEEYKTLSWDKYQDWLYR